MKKVTDKNPEGWQEWMGEGVCCPDCGKSPFRFMDQAESVYYQDREGCEWEIDKHSGKLVE